MNVTHLHVTQAYLIAVITQLAALVGGFGVVNNQRVGVWATAAAAVVNAGFLIANALHANAARPPVTIKTDPPAAGAEPTLPPSI